AWGFRHITFIDNGKVSYSNPTRQVLYNYYDCLNGGRRKAEAAADNLKNILPSVISKGIVAHIPMPGHPIGESLKDETVHNIDTITQAIAEHDVIFLLLDTREARPHSGPAMHGDAARRGCHSRRVGGGDTRRIVAASSRVRPDSGPAMHGVLGPIPHSIRGFLHSYTTVAPTCAKFKQCIACSDIVVNKYRTQGIEFLLNVFNSGNYLEDIMTLSDEEDEE
ncbi:Uncharacterized protein OBRU01_12297, partial [Operophtera brumata]